MMRKQNQNIRECCSCGCSGWKLNADVMFAVASVEMQKKKTQH